jgi:hypothetical protein
VIRWEYKSYLFEPNEKILDKLNQLGAEGWEAFRFSTTSQGAMRVLFKRPTETPTGEPQK